MTEIVYIKEIKEPGKQTEVVVEYCDTIFAVGSEFGLSGLQDGIEQGYLEDDLKTALKNPGNTENYVIRKVI